MEIYQIELSCTNNYSTRILDHVPENFEGVQIMQKFSWVNPMGYSPTVAVNTVKVILGDKTWLDAIFESFGLESVVRFRINKANSTNTAYVFEKDLDIDFESYVEEQDYSEFSLKTQSTIEDYNKTKNASVNFTGASLLALPSTQKNINYVSIKKTIGVTDGSNKAYIEFERNENERIFNDDTALYFADWGAYEFNRDAPDIVEFETITTAALVINFTYAGAGTTLRLKLYKTSANDPEDSTPVLEIATQAVVYGSSIGFDIDTTRLKISDLSITDNDAFFIGIEADDAGLVITDILGSLAVELYLQAESDANEYNRRINYLTAGDIFNTIFDNNATVEASLGEIGVTSAQSILKRANYLSFVPKDFANDFCIAAGALVNFKLSGGVAINRIDTFFEGLLDKDNAIEITQFQNFKMYYDLSLNFVSVSTGMEQRQYDVYTYFGDWNKVLTFKQRGKAASENLNLTLTKFRTDFSGILDYINKNSSASTDSSQDLFFFNPAFTPRSSNIGFIYDRFTPRDILTNWDYFLRIVFYNFTNNILYFDSNSGDDFNLELEPGYNEMDNYTFSGDEIKILPFIVEFTGLIELVDFSENIIKINVNGTDLFIFVTEAETTDKLNEQTIKGNLIYFPEV